jgi:predicted GIY-YIG superfamily endonuclease
LHWGRSMGQPKCIVYVLHSVGDPARYYTGLTSDLERRLIDHNEGRCVHTADGRPWRVDLFVHFSDEPRAVKFERYLKSGSGCAFAKRHLR